jgi:hypothetical protein
MGKPFRYEFSGLHGCKSVCEAEIVSNFDGTTKVVFTEVPDNRGTSITNAAALLATQFYSDFLSDKDQRSIQFVEHYPTSEVRFSRVHFQIADGNSIIQGGCISEKMGSSRSWTLRNLMRIASSFSPEYALKRVDHGKHQQPS